MAIPTQNTLSSFAILTSNKTSGLQSVTLGGASTGQQVNQVVGAAPTIAPEAVLGEVVESGLFSSQKSGVPTAGAPPTPAPTVYSAKATASTGQQPEVSTPDTDAAWQVYSTNPTVSVSGVTPGSNT